MSSLSKTWLTDHLIDFEYKKYLVLDYVQAVESYYKRSELYPYLPDAIGHFRNLDTLRQNADMIRQEAFKTASGFDWHNLSIQYHTPSFDNEAMEEVNRIIDFALPNFQVLVQHGKALYDDVEKHLSMSAVGIVPMRTREGYLFLDEASTRQLHVYQYAICNIEDIHEQSRMLGLQFVADYHVSIRWSYENVKYDLIKTRRDLPNPAAYVISCDLGVPFRETFLPVAKRYFMQRLGTA